MEQRKLPKYISLQEAGDVLSISPKTVRRYIASGELPGYTIGRRKTTGGRTTVRVRLEDVEALLRRIPTVGSEE